MRKAENLQLRPQGNLSQPNYRQTIDKRNKAIAPNQDTARQYHTTALLYNKRIFQIIFSSLFHPRPATSALSTAVRSARRDAGLTMTTRLPQTERISSNLLFPYSIRDPQPRSEHRSAKRGEGFVNGGSGGYPRRALVTFPRGKVTPAPARGKHLYALKRNV
jgi:hypothetical protein